MTQLKYLWYCKPWKTNQSTLPTTIFSNIYTVTAIHLFDYNQDSTTFQLHKGIGQGDAISPKFFAACLKEIYKKLNWTEKNYDIKIDGEFLSNLRFADDILLL